MALDVRLVGPQTNTSGVREVHVTKYDNFAGEHSGLEVLTTRFQNFIPTVLPFINSTFGNQMNQAIAFGGVAELIHDGQAVGVWAPVANAGTWNFADSAKITITSANHNDSATFSDATTTDMAGYTAITGKVDLDTYNPSNHNILMQFGFEGVPVGNSVNLEDYIDTGDFAEQGFAIPKADLGITSTVVDEMTITIERAGGSKPTIKFDDIQIEQTGTPAVFKVFAPHDKSDLHVKKVRFLLADVVTGAAGQSYDQILAVTALTNGIVVQIVKDGVVTTAVNIKDLSDMIQIGATIVTERDDGTNTFLALELEFSETVVLKRGQETRDFISITINDDLSGLLLFTGVARGAYEQ